MTSNNLEIYYRTYPGISWLPEGAGWRTESASWGVMHDLFHHRKGDRGTLAEELATLGAEYYVNHQPMPGQPAETSVGLPAGMGALSSGLVGTIGADFAELEMAPEHFVINEAPTVSIALDEISKNIFSRLEAEAVHELEQRLGGEEEWQPALDSFRTPGRIAQWIASGYEAARARFPSQEAARNAWSEGYSRLVKIARQAEDDDILLTAQLIDGVAVFSQEPHYESVLAAV